MHWSVSAACVDSLKTHSESQYYTCLLCSIRRVDWHFSVWAMLIMLLGVLPFYHCYRLLAGSGKAHTGGET